MREWWSWARWAITLPTRAIPLAIAGVAFVIAGLRQDTPSDQIGGWQGAVLMVGGAMMLYMLLGWRRFWYGQAVARKRQSSTST